MALRPVLAWQDAFQLNQGAAAGTQFLALIAGLANGGFVAVWTDDTNNVDDDPGTGIAGRIYDHLGVSSAGPFQINTFANQDQETDAEVVGIFGGTFMVVYEQNGNDGDTDLQFQYFNALGESIEQGNIALGSAGADQVRNPSIAHGPELGSVALVSFQRTSLGDTDVLTVTVGADGNVTAEQDAAQNSAGYDRNPDNAVVNLADNVTVYEEQDGGNTSIEMFINVFGAVDIGPRTVAANGSDPHIASRGDGCMVTWEDSSGNIRGRIYDASGNAQTASFVIASGAVNNLGSAVIVNTIDGYLAVWVNSTLDRIEGSRIEPGGTFLDNAPFTIEDGASLFRPELSLMADGRVLVSWDNGLDVFAEIVDPRDSVVEGTSAGEYLTSWPDGAHVYGFEGNDRLYGRDSADVLIGGDGNDQILGEGGNDLIREVSPVVTVDNDTVRCGGGDDVVIVSQGNDALFGDAGQDELNFEEVSGAVDVDLLAGTAELPSGLGSITLNTFERVVGSFDDDSIAGGSGSNTLDEAGGDDAIDGGNGNDTIEGGLGRDILEGGLGNDRFEYDGILDSGVTGATWDRIEDFGVGNDTINAATIDAASAAGNQTFAFIDNSAFSAEGQVRWFQSGANAIVEFNTSGNGSAEMRIQLLDFDGDTLAASDFAL